MKPKKPWSEDNIRLRRLYMERAPKGMSQKEFGRVYGIGTQGMVAQHLNGTRPLTYEAASKYAIGLRCTIYDISPAMGDTIKNDLLPVLGRPLRRAAMVLVSLLALQGSPDVEAAGILHKQQTQYTMLVKWVRRLWCAFSHRLYALRTLRVAQA